jgi:hypothetical protein
LIFRLSINSYNTQITSCVEFSQEFAPRASEQFLEAWVNVDRGPALCALFNNEVGWLMYLEKEGDAGFSSRNPAFEGSESSAIKYRLYGGQDDEYPASWALPKKEVISVIEFFIEHQGDRAPFITWHDDRK